MHYSNNSAAQNPQYAFARPYLSKMMCAMSFSIPFCLSMTATSVSAAANTLPLETITITGQHQPLTIESSLDPSQTSTPDMRDQLSKLPGLSINGNGAVSGIIQNRGLFADRVNVQIDGSVITAAGPNGMDSPLSHVIGTMGQEVKLYRGIAPVSVGAETIGGAVAIRNKTPELSESNQRTFSGQLSISQFDFNKTHYSALANIVNHNTFLSVNADKQLADNYRAADDTIIPSSFYEREGIKIRGGYVSKDITLEGFIGARNTHESGTPTLAMDIIYIDALLTGIDYTQRLNNQWQLKAQLRANNNEHVMNNFSLRTNTNNAMHRENYVDSEGRSISIKATQIDTQTDSSWRSEYGVDWRTNEHNSTITNPNMAMFYLRNFNDVQRNITSIYTQWQQDSTSDMQWLVGGRYSHVSADADTIDSNMAMMNPNVANLRDTFNTSQRSQSFDLLDIVGRMSFTNNQYSKWTFSASVKEQAPIYQQLYTWFPLGISAGMADGRNYLGNRDLTKETAYKIDINGEFTGQQWRFSPSVYWSQIDNYIIGMPSNNMSANMLAQMNNVALPLIWENQDARITGFDFIYQYTLNDDWSLDISGQYVRGKQTGSVNQALYRLAPLSGDVTLHWEQQVNDDRYGLSLHTELVAAQTEVAELQNETETSGYGVVNINGYFQFESGVKIQLMAMNVFNKNYSPHLAGVNRVAAAELAIGEKLLSIGRNIGLSISYEF